MKCSKTSQEYTAGLQNFFDIRWDNKSNRLRVFIARGFGKKVKLVPLYNYIDVNGKDGMVTYKTEGVMPYNTFPKGDLSQESLVIAAIQQTQRNH